MKNFDSDSYFMGYIDGSTDSHDHRPAASMKDSTVCIILGVIWLVSLLASCSV